MVKEFFKYEQNRTIVSKKTATVGAIMTAANAAIIAVLPLSASAQQQRAGTQFTAGIVMQRMGEADRYAFVAGVVEGLAVSRYLRDGRQAQGMNCIYDWFYKDRGTVDQIYTAFQRYPDHPPGTVILALAGRRCGE